MLLGGAGVFALHYANHLLSLKDTELVVSVGRNIRKDDHYSLAVGRNDARYKYEQVHIVFESERLNNLIDTYKPDYIINYAALAYATSWEESAKYYNTNLVAVAELAEFLLNKSYLKKFLQIGTSELYGAVAEPASETHPLVPTSPYAISKMSADLHLESMYRVKEFPMSIIRPSNAYGPGQQVWRIIPKAILYALTGNKLPLEGGGSVKKSYLYVDDLSRATHAVLKKGKLGETYNAGPEATNSIRELVEMVAKVTDIQFEDLCYDVPGRVGEDDQYWLDSSKIINELGWSPTVSLETGVAAVCEWCKANLGKLTQEETSFTLRA